MHLFLNGGPIANWFLSDAQSYNVKMDAIGVAPYYSMDSGAPSTVFCNNASLDQMADLLMSPGLLLRRGQFLWQYVESANCRVQ